MGMSPKNKILSLFASHALLPIASIRDSAPGSHLREARRFIEMVSAWLSKIEVVSAGLCIKGMQRPTRCIEQAQGCPIHTLSLEKVSFSPEDSAPRGSSLGFRLTPAPTAEHPVSTWLALALHMSTLMQLLLRPFIPNACVFTKQTLLLVPARNPEASSYFMYVDRELVNTSGWSPEHIGKQAAATSPGNPSIICSSQPWLPACCL